MLNKNEIESSVRESMNVVDNEIFKESLLAVSKVVKEKIEHTLGPYAHTTIIDDGNFKYPSKDGWNILKRVHFNDPFYQSLFGFLTQISTALVSTVGDGTTTAFVTASNFINEIEKSDIIKDIRQTDLVRILEEICADVEHIITSSDFNLVKYINKDGDYSDLHKIALLSSNGNKKIADVIQTVYNETQNPNIYVTIDKCIDIEHEIQSGFKLDSKLINPHIYANMDDGSFYSETPILVALFDHNISFARHGDIVGVLSRYASNMNKTIIIAAPNFDDTIMSVMGSQLNQLVQSGRMPNIMFMQTSLTKVLHKNYFKDFSIISNSTVFDMDKVHLLKLLLDPNPDNMDEINQYKAMLNVENLDANKLIESYLGKIEDVHIDKKQLVCKLNTASPSYKIHFEKVQDEFNEIKNKNEKYSTNSIEYMEAYLRYSRLLGKMGIIKVGGYSDIEKACLKDSVDDAVLACKSAYTYGYVRGMNITTINALNIIRENLESLQLTNDIKYKLVNLFIDVYRNTIISIFKNKYPEKTNDELIQTVNNIIDSCFASGYTNSSTVYNIVTEEYEDFNTTNVNVINPAKTDIEIIKAVVEILKLILTSNQMLTLNKFLGLKQTKSQYKEEKAEEYSTIASAVVSAIKNDLKDIFIPNITDCIDFVPEEDFK